MRYRPVDSRQKELPHTLCNIVVMEHLDRGNLHQVRQRLFFAEAEGIAVCWYGKAVCSFNAVVGGA